MEVDIKAFTDESKRISNEEARCRRLRQIPGFGPLVSTATMAAIGNGTAFRRGRDFAARVAVVPRDGRLRRVSGLAVEEPEAQNVGVLEVHEPLSPQLDVHLN